MHWVHQASSWVKKTRVWNSCNQPKRTGGSGWKVSILEKTAISGEWTRFILDSLDEFHWWIFRTPEILRYWEFLRRCMIRVQPESSVGNLETWKPHRVPFVPSLIFVQEGQKLIDPLLKDPTAQARDLGQWLADFFSYKTWRNGRASPIGWWKLYVFFCTFLPDVWMIVVVQLFLAC